MRLISDNNTTKHEVPPSKYFELPSNKLILVDVNAKSTEFYKYYIITGQRWSHNTDEKYGMLSATQ